MTVIIESGRLDEKQRQRVKKCLAKDRIRLPSERFEQLIRDIEASIADFLANTPGESFREAHDALRRMWDLSHEDDLSLGLLRRSIRALPTRAADYLNRRSLMDIDPEQIEALQLWEPDANLETLTARVLSAEGARIVEGRSRGSGKRSKSRLEPIIMGEARGAAGRTHRGGRPKSAEQEELVMFLALDWLHATEQEPMAGRGYHGFGDLVHCVFAWLGLPKGSAAYALRQYWGEVNSSKEPTFHVT
jgi:hypothetical protein